MTTEKLYDTAGRAPALCYVIHMAGRDLLPEVLSKTPTKARCREVIALAIECLESQVEMTRKQCERMRQRRPEWVESRSLRVAEADALHYITRLREFDAEEADHESDEAYAGSALELAMALYERDHAYRVACPNAPGKATPGVPTHPGYADELESGPWPGDSARDNIVQLDGFRRRRPARTTTDTTPAA